MSSYLSRLKSGEFTALEFLKRSAGWLARQAGATDETIDELVFKADRATDEAVIVVEGAILAVLAKGFPALPAAAAAVVAHRVAVIAMEQVDTAISAAGAVIKDAN
ncbi:MAG: hypothetical protein ACK4YQ_08570 [Phenylobacterium sp.]|uniref:hypothetical protein n=1 Tax=Phenylobacterium sp. TaxID=1871053 RepID=UPI00391DBE39